MNSDIIKYSSANGEIWAMATFKVKYCHKIFKFSFVRQLCCVLLEEAMNRYKIRYEKMGFDDDHVHIMLEMGLFSKPEMAKNLKGYSANKLFRLIPWLKKKYFWASGLWNPAYDIRTHDPGIISRYIDKQKYAYAGQKMLTSF